MHDNPLLVLFGHNCGYEHQFGAMRRFQVIMRRPRCCGTQEMKHIGNGNLAVFDKTEYVTHTPSSDELWQESVVLMFWDLNHKVGGMYRIGHEVNLASGPMVSGWNYTFTPQGHLKHHVYLPLRTADRHGGHFGNGEGSLCYDGDANEDIVWTITEPDLEATLTVRDFHAPIDGWPKGAVHASDISPNHIDLACKITGTLRVKGHSYDINTLGVRDHAWGTRHWKAFRSHRWCVAAFGPELSLCAMTMQAPDDSLSRYGWIVRGDTVIHADSIDIVTYMGIDGISTSGGRVKLVLPGGEILCFEFEREAPSAVAFFHGICNADTLSKVTCGSQVGIGCFESSNNPLLGSSMSNVLECGVYSEGWHDITI